MKKLLLLSVLFLGSLTASAQYDCTDPIVITADGTVNAPDVTGTFVSGVCYTHAFDNTGAGDMYGLWYTYTPATSGEVHITTNLPQNVAPNSEDTKISIFTGDCAALECYDANDDVDGTNFLSDITFPVAAGVTYYIQWDNYWDGAPFDFDFTFTAVSCGRPFYFNAPTGLTTTAATLNWEASVSSPTGYEIEYGLTGFVQGTGTVVSSATNSVSLSGLTANSIYDYYVRSICSVSSQSAWSEVQTLILPKLLPYASGLDNDDQLGGWTISGGANQGLGNNATAAQSPAGYWIMNTAAAPGPNNNWLFAPAMYLQANEQVTVSFWHRATTTARTLRITVGASNTVAGQTTQLLAAAIPAGTTWTQVTVPAYTATTAGIYYFAFNDNSTATPAAATSMRLDTFNFTSVLGTSEFLSSKFSVYPNPATNVINITNDDAVISSVDMTDMNGRVIKSVKFNATQAEVSVSDLATGIYMMKITTDQGVATKKVVKE